MSSLSYEDENDISRLQCIKTFVHDVSISDALETIRTQFLDVNVLEITGMGNKEIKHSNVLAWFLGDNDQDLEYRFFNGLLKKIYHSIEVDDELFSYIYLETKQKIEIYREKDNIDLLIVDTTKRFVFVIENKISADERTEGMDGGQLKKYEKMIMDKYPDSDRWKQFFIYLTPDGKQASRENWHIADYQMISKTLQDLLIKGSLSDNTRLIMESYIDLLKRRNIVEDKQVEEICNKIWSNKEYKKALDIIYNYRPDIFSDIRTVLEDRLGEHQEEFHTDQSNKTYIRFSDQSWEQHPTQQSGEGWVSKRVFLYEFQNFPNGLKLRLYLGPTNDESMRGALYDLIKNDEKFKKSTKSKNKKWNIIWDKVFLTEKDIEDEEFEELKKIITKKFGDFLQNEYKSISQSIEYILTQLENNNELLDKQKVK